MKILQLSRAFYLFNLVILLGCASSSSVKKNVEINRKQDIQLPQTLVQKLQSGTDFWAEGESPVSWTLSMDFDKQFYFEANNGIRFTNGPVTSVRNSQLNTDVYTIQNAQGDAKIVVYDTKCGHSNPQVKVEITVNNTLYAGCGEYLYNSNLDGIWELAKIGNKQITSADFQKGIPRFKFDLANLAFSGFDGCNKFSTDFIAKGNRVKIGNIITNQKGCKFDDLQDILMKKISNQLVDYYFKDGKLYLYLIDDSTLIFNRLNS